MPNTPIDSGRCDHFQPSDFIAMAEDYLSKKGIPETDWDGYHFSWGGQLVESPRFKGIYMELIRRKREWVLTRLDRRVEPVPMEELGLREV